MQIGEEPTGIYTPTLGIGISNGLPGMVVLKARIGVGDEAVVECGIGTVKVLFGHFEKENAKCILSTNLR